MSQHSPMVAGGGTLVGSLSIGALVGEYRLESLLGASGMGEVYGASHTVIGKRVAVKVMNRLCSANPLNVDRFITEAKAVNAIGHPNIVDIFSFGRTEDGRCYFVMEWLVGENLRDRMDRQPLALAHTLDIVDGVLRALEAAHAIGVVHRDLEPDNIFLVAPRSFEPDEPERVKLLDFGIAKLADADVVASTAPRSHKSTGTVVGTPSYMSPEQAAGLPVTGPADVYSLAVVAFELVTGQLPFDGDSAAQIMAKHVDQPAPRPSSIRPVPPALDALLLEMLVKPPAERPRPAAVRARVKALRDELGDPRPRPRTPAVGVRVPTTAAGPYQPATVAAKPVGAVTAVRGRVSVARGSRMSWVLPALGLIAMAIAAAVVINASRSSPPSPPPRTAAPTQTAPQSDTHVLAPSSGNP